MCGVIPFENVATETDTSRSSRDGTSGSRQYLRLRAEWSSGDDDGHWARGFDDPFKTFPASRYIES